MKKYTGPRDTTPPSSRKETMSEAVNRVGSALWKKATDADAKTKAEAKAKAKAQAQAEGKGKEDKAKAKAK